MLVQIETFDPYAPELGDPTPADVAEWLAAQPREVQFDTLSGLAVAHSELIAALLSHARSTAGAGLRAERASRELTLGDVADLLHVPVSTVSDAERGRNDKAPKLLELLREVPRG